MMNQPPTALDASLRGVWKRTHKKHLSAGWLALSIIAIPLFIAAILLDRFVDLPPAARVAVLLSLVGASLHRAWQRGWRHLRRFDPLHSAMQIEDHHGGLDTLLVTAVQFRDRGATPGTSSSLWEATLRKANATAQSIRPAEVVSFTALRRPLRLAALALLAIGILALTNGPFLAAGLTRIFTPWVRIAYPTKTRIAADERPLVIKEGDAANIDVQLSGVVPRTAKFELLTGQGKPKAVVINVRDGLASYAIASASRDFRYRIKAGDARSAWHDVRVIRAPRIATANLLLTYPDYQQRPPETVEAMTLTVPEGTRVKWQLTLDQPIRQAVLHRDGAPPLNLEVATDGRQLAVEEQVLASRGYHFSWVEKIHGFRFDSPRYHMQVSSDEAPRIEFVTPATNLFATNGRPIDFAVRAQDDHGIATTTITYRVNLRPEKSITLEKPLKNGDGEQPVGWDYRKEITDLKEGDSVSFVIEVADTYPAPDGPHRARTDTRRITILSRDDYLAQIETKTDRLLTRVRSIYRQERAAHELVRSLDINQPSFTQTCQLEAIRQELLREQLSNTAAETRLLVADLAANNITNDPKSNQLSQLAKAMDAIATDTIAQAAAMLRDQAGIGKSNAEGLIAATHKVNQAARELASLVMRRGIDAATEVFALETQMLSSEQAELRARTVERTTSPEPAAIERLANHQAEIASWTRELLDQLTQTLRYDNRPLAILHLTRRMHDLRAAKTETRMRQIAELTRQGDLENASAAQSAVVRDLLTAEFSVRTGAEYAAVSSAVETLTTLIAAQAKLRADCEAITSPSIDPEIARRQQAVRATFLRLPIPAIPAPRIRLYDESQPQPPPIDALRTAAEKSLTASLAHLTTGKRQDAITEQRAAETALTKLNASLNAASADLALRTVGLTSLVSASIKRLSRIEELETRQIQLLEQTEEAALDEKPTRPLAEPQQRLTADLETFKTDLHEENRTHPDKDVMPILDRIDAVAKAMADATTALAENKGEDALAPQESASDALALLKELIESQTARLSLLQDIFAFQRAVGSASLTMLDLVNAQNDLIVATENADEDDLEALLPTLGNLLRCLTDVAPLFDLVASRLDVGSALLFAQSDIEDAIAAIEDADQEDSLDAQQVAAESLAKVQSLIQAVSEQNGYLAEIMEFLHQSLAEATLIESTQQQLRTILQATPDAIPAEITQRQQALQNTADAFARALVKTTGIQDFHQPATLIADATRLTLAGESAAAIEAMRQSESALRESSEQILLVISVLHGLSSIDVLTTSPPELPELIEILGLASDQKNLYRAIRFNNDDDLSQLLNRQQKLDARYAKFTDKESPHPLLAAARMQAAQANPASPRETLLATLEANDQSLRHFIVAQAILLNTVAVPPAASSDPVLTEAESTDLSKSIAGMVSDFVSGEAPKDQRSEWETLGTRNRAALNQNFARELPLEFRSMLKDYYEKVAK